jgi:hypothetical protein
MSTSPDLTTAVYTALLGGYERLNDAQHVGDGTVPFICFTDDASLTSSVWDIRVVSPLFPGDLHRSQREIKIRGCSDLEQFDRTLYIDNSVSLTGSPEVILDSWLDGQDIAVPLHSWRETVREEFAAVAQWGLDDADKILEQLSVYTDIAPEILDQRPTWNGMIARRNGPAVGAVMDRWFDEVLRYSRRDQLSSNYVFGQSPIPIGRIEFDNHNSGTHLWRVDMTRAPRAPVSSFQRRKRARLATRSRGTGPRGQK